MEPKPSRGVYFLANDRVYELVVAFLNSLRVHSPDAPLCLIPYDNDTERIRALQKAYNFSVFDDDEVLSSCDKISLRFHKRIRGHYRKLAAWTGAFEEFVYIDIDTIVLRSFDSLFPLLAKHDVVVAHSHDPNSRQFVWKYSLPADAGLSPEEIEFSANTGFIMSRREVIDPRKIDELVESATKLAPHMDLQCYEQPLLNFLIVKSTKRYTSIRRLNEISSEEELPVECWAGYHGWKLSTDGMCLYHGRPRAALFVHWSGEIVPRGWEKRLYAILSRIGIAPPVMKLRVKQRHIWRYYRNLRACAKINSHFRLARECSSNPGAQRVDKG